MLVEQLNKLGEVGQGAGQAVDLIDDDYVDPASLHILQEPLQGWPVGVAARESAVVEFVSQQRPPGVRLAPDIGLGRFILGVERVEVLICLLYTSDAADE